MSSAAAIQMDHQQQAESAAWSRFSAPKDRGEFCASWLAILCQQLGPVDGALLVLGPDADGGFSAAAVWPDRSRNMQYLGAMAEKTLAARRGMVERLYKERRQLALHVKNERRAVRATPGVQVAHVGYPLEVDGVLRGAVVFELHQLQDVALQNVLRLVHWASAWLLAEFRQQNQQQLQQRLERLTLASDLMATAVQYGPLVQSGLAVANELCLRLNCARVALGIEQNGQVRVEAVSNTAKFDRKANVLRAIADAMDEVLDLNCALAYPAPQAGLMDVLAHKVLCEQANNVAVCSVPLWEQGRLVGVLSFERTTGTAFTLEEFELCKTIGLLLGPLFWLKHQQDRVWWLKAWHAGRDYTRRLFGPAYPGTKLIALSVLLVLGFFTLVDGQYRVASKTVIEGAVQRAIVVPYAGFVATSSVRAGDSVRKGQLLARLDDKELRLEQRRLSAEYQQIERRYRQVLAEQDRAGMAIVEAQLTQAQAQLALAEEKLQRAELRAPFDGLVVRGDLSQLLGTPVEQGKVLFEVAPLDQYRVVMQVDERDIAAIKTGQTGQLSLSGMPYQTLNFVVKQITPVSVAKDGVNYFQVEAQLQQYSERLRPGMEGVGKVDAGERKLIWIWTHSLVDWCRLWLWKWLG